MGGVHFGSIASRPHPKYLLPLLVLFGIFHADVPRIGLVSGAVMIVYLFLKVTISRAWSVP